MLREWSNKTGEDFKGDLCSFRVHNMFWGQNVPYLPLTLKTLSVIVNYFVSVDVILLPELGFEGVEEGVGAVMEHDALHHEAVVLQPALLGAHQPGPGPGHLPQPVHAEAAQVLHIGAVNQGL